MKIYIKPVSILIKMDPLTLLAGSTNDNTAGIQITNNGKDNRSDIIDQTGEQVGGGSAFAKQGVMPFDAADDNMDW